jgi:hypothetical protein
VACDPRFIQLGVPSFGIRGALPGDLTVAIDRLRSFRSPSLSHKYLAQTCAKSSALTGATLTLFLELVSGRSGVDRLRELPSCRGTNKNVKAGKTFALFISLLCLTMYVLLCLLLDTLIPTDCPQK